MRKKLVGVVVLIAVVALLVDFGVLPATVLFGDTNGKPSRPLEAKPAESRPVPQTAARPEQNPALAVNIQLAPVPLAKPTLGFPVVDPSPVRATAPPAPTGGREALSPLWAMRQAVADLEKRQASLRKQQAESTPSVRTCGVG